MSRINEIKKRLTKLKSAHYTDKDLQNFDDEAPADIQFLLKEVVAYKKGAVALHRGLDEYMKEIKTLEEKLCNQDDQIIAYEEQIMEMEDE